VRGRGGRRGSVRVRKGRTRRIWDDDVVVSSDMWLGWARCTIYLSSCLSLWSITVREHSSSTEIAAAMSSFGVYSRLLIYGIEFVRQCKSSHRTRMVRPYLLRLLLSWSGPVLPLSLL
jgi:hypothetical protein